MKKTKKVFRSRISVLLVGFILAIFILVSIPMFYYKLYEELYILGGALLIAIPSTTGHRYIISGNKLYLKIWIIPMGSANILDIISLERTYNPLSSPAASLKRLRVCFVKGAKYSNWVTWQTSPDWLVSPVREQEFIEELKTVNPDIYVNIPDKKGMWRIWDWDI